MATPYSSYFFYKIPSGKARGYLWQWDCAVQVLPAQPRDLRPGDQRGPRIGTELLQRVGQRSLQNPRPTCSSNYIFFLQISSFLSFLGHNLIRFLMTAGFRRDDDADWRILSRQPRSGSGAGLSRGSPPRLQSSSRRPTPDASAHLR